MKGICITSLFVFLSLLGFSQYFVTESSLWSCSLQGTEWNSPLIVYWVKFEGDTIIGDHEYKRIRQSSDSLQALWITIGYVREDSLGRVYKKNYADEEEFITFDFSLQQDDSIHDRGEYYNYVQSVDYKQFGIDQRDRKHINFQWFSWIEGVGSLSGPLWGLNVVDYLITGIWYRLLCYFEHGELVYHDGGFSSCFPVSANSINLVADRLRVNTADGVVRLQTECLNTYGAEFSVLDIMGRVVHHERLAGQLEWEVPLGGVAPGIYIYRLRMDGRVWAGKFLTY